jgi:hypothetical protein
MASWILPSFASVLVAITAAFAAMRRRRRVRERQAVASQLRTDPLARPVAGHRPALAEAAALHLTTVCDGVGLLERPAEGPLRVTEEALAFDTVAGWSVPHERVVEAVFVARHDRWASGPGGVLMRLTWLQAGRPVTAVFMVQGRRLDAERLRKELHLRAGSARPLALP